MSTNTTGTDARQYEFQVLHFIRRTIAYNTTFVGTAATIKVGALPSGAVIYDAIVKINTAFNAGTTNYINVGTSASSNSIVDQADIDATAAEWQSVRRGCDLTISADTNIYVTYTQSGTAATAGEAEIIVAYIPDNDL